MMNTFILLLFVLFIVLICQKSYSTMGGSRYLDTSSTGTVTYDDVNDLLNNVEEKQRQLAQKLCDMPSQYGMYKNRISNLSSNRGMVSKLTNYGYNNELSKLKNEINTTSHLSEPERSDLKSIIRSRTLRTVGDSSY